MTSKLNRILYLGYYLKQLDREKFHRFLDYVCESSGRSKSAILSDVISSVFKYNISILEYFQFRFYERSKEEREAWAGTGYMYEYQLEMNPKHERHILDDKLLFYQHYHDFFVHQVFSLKEIENPEKALEILSNPAGKIVLKASDGKCGAQVEVIECKELDSGSLYDYMKEKNYGLAEEFIQQHPKINRLSPSAVNTVRIFTQLNVDGDVEFLGCRLRISVDSPVDNLAAGNLAAPVDEESGVVTGPGVYSDITKPSCDVHPVTGVHINGFQIPCWTETLELVKKASILHPQNRSIGWDVVITEQGPGLIEGNHDWCKLLWQLPVQKGLKHRLETHLNPEGGPSDKAGKKTGNEVHA